MSFAALFVWSALPWLVASTFTFTSTAPTQCDDFQISWKGGSGPYYLSIVPIFDVLRNISIPASAFSNGNGTFSTTMPFNASDRIVLTLSDSTGFGAGGSTQLLTVGKSLGGTCNTTSPGLAFSFETPGPLVQCQPYLFSNYTESGGIAPVTILGVIPGGDSFVLDIPHTSDTYSWVADAYNGTQIIFSLVDAKFRQGGSFLNTVELSGDSSCINAQSPSSTIDPSTSPTSSGSPSKSPTSTSVPATTPIGAIAGSVLGALLFLAVLITLGLFLLRQRQEKKKARMAGGSEFRRTSRPMDSELDLTYDAHHNASNVHPYMSPSNAATPTTSLFNGQHGHASSQGPSRPPAHYQPHSQYLSSQPESDGPFAGSSNPTDVDPFMDQSPSESVSGRRKSGMSGLTSYKSSRYVLHTDAEDDPLAEEEEVVELPPQYSAARAPARLPPSSSHNAPPL